MLVAVAAASKMVVLVPVVLVAVVTVLGAVAQALNQVPLTTAAAVVVARRNAAIRGVLVAQAVVLSVTYISNLRA